MEEDVDVEVTADDESLLFRSHSRERQPDLTSLSLWRLAVTLAGDPGRSPDNPPNPELRPFEPAHIHPQIYTYVCIIEPFPDGKGSSSGEKEMIN